MAKDSNSAATTTHSSDSVTKVEALDHKKEQIKEKGIALDMIATSDAYDDLESDINSGLKPIICVGINHENDSNVDQNFRVALIEAKLVELESKIKFIEVAKKTEFTDKDSGIGILLLKKKLMELETAVNSIELELSKSKNAVNISNVKVGEFEKELKVLKKKMEHVIILGSSKKHEMNLKLAFGVGAIAVVVGGIVISVYCAWRM